MTEYSRTYLIRVYRDGDVRLSCPGYVEYSQTYGLSDLECREPYHKAVRFACMDVASAIRALDDTIEASEDIWRTRSIDERCL
jgi:hypothetical protein